MGLFFIFFYELICVLCVYVLLPDPIGDEGPQTVMCHCASMKVHNTDKNNHEAITVRALHALLSRVTYSEQIGARCRAQGLLYRMHGS